MAWLDTQSWREPLWLLVALQPLLLLAITRLVRRIRHDDFADAQLLPWLLMGRGEKHAKQLARKLALLVAWLAFAISLAGPRQALKSYTTDTSAYTSVIVVFDVSRSMSARDVVPSRLERARLELYDFIERSQHTRIGLSVFAAKPHLLSPLTTDKAVLRHYVATISTPLLPTRGSDLDQALQYAQQQLVTTTSRSRAILLISDGENQQQDSSSLDATLQQLKENNIAVYALAAGTESGAPLLADESGWLSYENQDVISRPDHMLLQNMAIYTNGKFSLVEDDDTDWQQLYDNGIARLAQQSLSKQKETDLVVWKEYYPWSLTVALFFFLLGQWHRPAKRPVKNISLASASVSLLLLVILLSPTPGYAEATYQQAYRAYQRQEYGEAAELFSRLKGYDARMGEASAAYQDKHYKQAIALFIQASLEGTSHAQRSHALFNLANSYYQLKHYEQAAAIYQDVLRYQPGLQQAQINLAYASELASKQKENELPVTSRGSKGARLARTAPDTEIGKGLVTLDDDSGETMGISPGTGTQGVVDLSLSSAGLVSQEVERATDSNWSYQVTKPEQIATIINQVKTNEVIFWRRMFEWEEGFPAPLDEPRSRPGVKPW